MTAVAPAAPPPQVSVLVPAKDEAENLPEFVRQCAEAFAADPDTRYELVIVDDGSTDGSWALLEALARRHPFVRPVRHRAQRGIAEALRTGWLATVAPVLVFYPADLQFRPADIPRLAAPVLAGEADMVTGRKIGQYEKAFVSGIYNRLSRALFRVPVTDLNSVKAYRREVMDLVPTRPDWHRYLIAIAVAEGFTVAEIPVTLHPRVAGRSKFGLSRIPVGVLDMLAVWFELRFGRKPLLLFGMLGVAMFGIGVLAGLAALVVLAVAGIGVRAVWTVITTCLLLGSVFFATGLLGEQVAGLRADLRELRRRLDDVSGRPGA